MGLPQICNPTTIHVIAKESGSIVRILDGLRSDHRLIVMLGRFSGNWGYLLAICGFLVRSFGFPVDPWWF